MSNALLPLRNLRRLRRRTKWRSKDPNRCKGCNGRRAVRITTKHGIRKTLSCHVCGGIGVDELRQRGIA